MGTEDAIVFTTGNQANVGTLGTILAPGDTVIVDSGDHASILDGCMLSRAKLRPFRHNRLDKLEKMLQRAARRRRRRPGRRRRRLLDGGRHRPAAGDLRPLRGLRRPPDGRRGPRRRRARRPRRGRQRAARRRGPRRPADGHVLEVAGLLRRLRRRQGRRHRVPAHPVADLPLHRLGRARRRPAPRWPRCGSCAADEGRRCWRQVQDNARYFRDGLEERGFAVVESQELPAGHPYGADIVTPIIPVLIGDDWQAGLMWKGLYEAGVFVNTALHPAVPPGGALLRTSVMATHDRADARPGAGGLHDGQGRPSRPSTARCPGRASTAAAAPPDRRSDRSPLQPI